MLSKEELLTEMQTRSQKAIQGALNDQIYDDAKVEEWGSTIVKNVLSEMKELCKSKYKFVTNIMIFSRNKQCIHECQMAYYDNQKDVKITTKWANETMQCILSLWGFRTRFG
ncbi:Tctex-1 family protein [Trichomonas vaginalis G3]|uniref:Tctex-1 family protein n=1 Tax=Trichomonas vaginalis (strain ATCC PRA-98 / G3) TaxID=412133 RepID=A2DHA4_TRIV3|nr:intracellular transport of viral protein in host cell [Trichomonas vaginalis G3]EAY20177.1 Tctex-1 family protein [Trichomonas vaginalis G3]KAI5507657.1 intracellular transport of viral protein in host cell [Trichomonas vaginalis G3]|eukprot:XP_001581163.1 Tctex-1 family protein [Trichomonas vaginalis G3]